MKCYCGCDKEGANIIYDYYQLCDDCYKQHIDSNKKMINVARNSFKKVIKKLQISAK